MKTRMSFDELVEKSVKSFAGRDDVWYSDIWYVVKSEFPRNANMRTALYGAICDRLQANKVWVHS